MESRHSGHTGRREMFTRGILQSLQSEGKKTEKTLWTAATIGATRDVRCSARSLRRCRSRVARLLKTTLQSMMLPTRNARSRYRGTESTGAISIVISTAPCNADTDSRTPIHRRFMPREDFRDSAQIFPSLQSTSPRRDRMDSAPSWACTKCSRHANLRRHIYLGSTRGLRI